MSVVAIKSDAIARRQASEYLESLAQRLRMWKLREGKSYFSMPTALWDEAVTVAHKIGPGAAARALGLNREELTRRMGPPASAETANASAAKAVEEEAQFVELPGVARALAAPPPATESPERSVVAAPAAPAEPAHTGQPGEAMVEVTAADGAKLTVYMPVADLDISSLVHAFRSRA